MTREVVVREVGLRDGLQIVSTFMPTCDKKEWVDRCVDAGILELEVCSFVPDKYIPQFRDAEEIAAYARGRRALATAAFVPNIAGARRALAAGVDKIVCALSATESFSQANLRRPKARNLEELRAIVSLRDHMACDSYRATIQAGISVAFGCPFEGRVADRDVRALAVAAAEAGADEISLADTAGQGDPRLVRRLFRALTNDLSDRIFVAHFHDTRGTGLANVLAAFDAGIRSFDASIAGLGGCPNSPGATGNIATEDLVFMLESMGVDTGIDLHRLFEIRRFVAGRLAGVMMSGHVAAVGLPKGFALAASVRVETAENVR